MWQKYNGFIPEGMCVCHTCDNPPCINITHLFLATNVGNTQDKTNKGRAARGEENGAHKLTFEDVLAIRSATGSAASIARKFGISDVHCMRIRKRASWKHL